MTTAHDFMSGRQTKGSVTLPRPTVSRSNISIFIRCLHILDLDLLEDWPGITESAFSSKTAQQNLQQRIRGVEWSLYRLFEIYSPQETRDVGLVDCSIRRLLTTSETETLLPTINHVTVGQLASSTPPCLDRIKKERNPRTRCNPPKVYAR